jgi:hypothetical protein
VNRSPSGGNSLERASPKFSKETSQQSLLDLGG